MTKRISRIVPLERRGGYAVTIDDGHAFEVDEEVRCTLRLHEGEEIDSATEKRARRDAERNRAKERALRLLEVRARSTAEIRKRLAQAGFHSDAVEAVIEWLTSLGYLDDLRFAEEWVEARTRGKPMGRRRLRHELQQKGIEKSIVERVLEPIDDEREVELAVAAASPRIARMADLSPEERNMRVFGFLSRRGFDERAIHQAASRLLGLD